MQHAAINYGLSKVARPSVRAGATGITQKGTSRCKRNFGSSFLPPNSHGFVAAEYQAEPNLLEKEDPFCIYYAAL